jgi:hypothetical protein
MRVCGGCDSASMCCVLYLTVHIGICVTSHLHYTHDVHSYRLLFPNSTHTFLFYFILFLPGDFLREFRRGMDCANIYCVCFNLQVKGRMEREGRGWDRVELVGRMGWL